MKPTSANMVMINEDIRLQDITHWAPAGSCKELLMLRLDEVHPVVSGNKWYKLRYNIAAAKSSGKASLLTFGGGYSNHLVATAFAAQAAGLQSTGIVRGRYDELTPTLAACQEYGMQLHFFSKAEYEVTCTQDGLKEVGAQYPKAFLIPEGGANDPGIQGAGEIAGFIPRDVDEVCVAVGTGTTMAGLHSALPSHTILHGFCAARNCDHAIETVSRTGSRDFGKVTMHAVSDNIAFGKTTPRLIGFMQAFLQRTGIPLDIVYTGKMMMSIGRLLQEGQIKDHKVLCIHTGGLQGNPPSLFA